MFETKSDFNEVLKDVTFNDWEIKAFSSPNSFRFCYLQVSFKGPNNFGGIYDEWRGRKWWLSKHMTRSEIVQTALMAILAAVEHEARESFLYLGESIFDPHYDVDKLWALRGSPSTLDKRKFNISHTQTSRFKHD